MRNLFICMILLSVVSCIHVEPEVVDMEPYGSDYEGDFVVTKESDLDLNNPDLWRYDYGEATKASSTTLFASVAGILSSALSTKVHQVVGTYTSTDVHGNPITVSGKIVYPVKQTIKNYIIVSHYTIGANFECPSESFSFESIYAIMGYAVIIADYIGFGVSADVVHPYLQADVTAGNVIDFALVARPFLASRGLSPLSDEVILVGYSQGGATTMHVQRLIENYPKYKGQFKIKKNYAGSGPYNIARTYDYSIYKDVTGIPCAIPLIIQGMSVGMSKPLDMTKFFKEPLLSNYDEWLNSKKYTVMQISEKIGSNKLSDMLTDEAMNKKSSATSKLYRQLAYNSIPVNFIPQAPVFMFHSEDDSTVPFINSQILQRQFMSAVITGDLDAEYDFGHYGNHQQGAMKCRI